MISRRWLYVCLTLSMGAGFIWGAIFGRYIGYQQGNLVANREWLVVVRQVLMAKCPANPCDKMPVPLEQDDERTAGVTNGKLYTMSEATH